jgi:hypothetical protein
MAASPGAVGSGVAGTVGVGAQFCGAGSTCAPTSAGSLGVATSGFATGVSVRPDKAVRSRRSAAVPRSAPSSRTLDGVAARRPWLLADPLLGRFALRPDDAGLLRRCVVRSPSPRAVRFVASVCERRRCWVDRVDLPLACPLSRVDALARPRR